MGLFNQSRNNEYNLRKQIVNIYNLLKRLGININVSYPSLVRQKTVTGNVTLNDSYNNSIVKVKGNATITIPANLVPEFNCVFRTYNNITATFAGGVGATMDAPDGLVLSGHKMATLFKDGSTVVYVLEGELTV